MCGEGGRDGEVREGWGERKGEERGREGVVMGLYHSLFLYPSTYFRGIASSSPNQVGGWDYSVRGSCGVTDTGSVGNSV